MHTTPEIFSYEKSKAAIHRHKYHALSAIVLTLGQEPSGIIASACLIAAYIASTVDPNENCSLETY
jgi:hypothetical protein